ncbi:MAG: thiamine S protein [Deltaproteobacteria bacterium]|nr:thiamine S protein [Deltaproteobacteria bacterium]
MAQPMGKTRSIAYTTPGNTERTRISCNLLGRTGCGYLTPRPGQTQLFGGDTMYNAPMITVRLPQKKKELELPGPRRVMDLLADAGVRPTTVIVSQGRKLLTKDHRVEDGATIDVISVVSGG